MDINLLQLMHWTGEILVGFQITDPDPEDTLLKPDDLNFEIMKYDNILGRTKVVGIAYKGKEGSRALKHIAQLIVVP